MRVSDSSTFAAVGIALLTSLKSRSDSDHQKEKEANSGTGMQFKDDRRETFLSQEMQASAVRKSPTGVSGINSIFVLSHHSVTHTHHIRFSVAIYPLP